MAQINLELPSIQNWNCHNCGGCCTQHGIFITDEEKKRIESQNWTPDDGIPADQPVFVKMGGWFGKPWHRLAHQDNGGCVFLDDQGLCRIHGKFGEDAKPLACRIYPYAFHPAGNKVTVSLRFSCPSVADNHGEPVSKQRQELKAIAKQVVPDNVNEASQPMLRPGTKLEWNEIRMIVDRLDETFSADAASAVLLLRALFWMDMLNQTQFGAIRGERLKDLLDIITQAATVEIPTMPTREEPSFISRGQFRLLAGQYARKDTYTSSDQSLSGRFRMLQFALRLTSGRGLLPSLDESLKEVSSDALEGDFGPIPHESAEMLIRYFRVKVRSFSFCGPAYYNIPMVEGFYSLALVYPAVMWIARWLVVSDGREMLTHEDLRQALTMADHQHGYSPAFGTWGFRRRVKSLMQLGDVQKLIGWYAPESVDD